MTVDTSNKMGETPIFSTKAHVFHIDPQTKRSWISASSAAVNVNFYYDMARNLYRIISVEGQKAVINSIITPNMTFTKTSQKFGQWSDIRANTVYGLGFSSEPELNKFIEKFQEVKEATRSTQSKSSTLQHNGGGGGGHHHPQLHQQQHLSGSSSVMSARDSPRLSSEMANDILLTGSLLPHQRSQSLSGLQAAKHLTDSPKYGTGGGSGGSAMKPETVKQQHSAVSSILLPQSSTEAQLRYENDRLKLALAQSSTNAKKWEIELQTLKSNNTRLTNALQESTANVEEWKRQLQALKDENTKMKHKIVELEAIQGNPEAIAELRKEIAHMRANCETLESDLKHRDGEVERLRKRLDEQCQAFGSSSAKVDDKIKALLTDNEGLRLQLNRLSGGSDSMHLHNNNHLHFAGDHLSGSTRSLFEQLNHRFAQNIADLRSLHAEYQEYSTLLNA